MCSSVLCSTPSAVSTSSQESTTKRAYPRPYRCFWLCFWWVLLLALPCDGSGTHLCALCPALCTYWAVLLQIPLTGLFAGLTLGLLSLDIVGLKVSHFAAFGQVCLMPELAVFLVSCIASRHYSVFCCALKRLWVVLQILIEAGDPEERKYASTILPGEPRCPCSTSFCPALAALATCTPAMCLCLVMPPMTWPLLHQLLQS